MPGRPSVASTRTCSAVLLASLLAAGAAAGCGRARPSDDVPTATAPVETGAFGDAEGVAGRIAAASSGRAARLLVAAAAAFAVEEPDVEVTLDRTATDALAELCAGDADLAASAGRVADAGGTCDGGGAEYVELHVAHAGGEPVVLYVEREALLRFEVESFVQSIVDQAESLAREAGVAPLSVEELQATQTRLEQVLAGVA